MKVILLENVPNLGRAGDVVDVKPGYARNHLLARRMAQSLSKEALAEVEEIKRVAIRRADRELESAREIASKLRGHTITMQGKTGARGAKLYGSVTKQALARAIGDYLGVEIDKRKLSIPEAIKTLGMYRYVVRLHPEVEVEGQVEVVRIPEPG